MTDLSFFQMSCYGSLLILAIIGVRAVFGRRIHKQICLLLWCVAVLRLLIPFSVPSVTSIYSLLSFGINKFQSSLRSEELEWAMEGPGEGELHLIISVPEALHNQPFDKVTDSEGSLIFSLIWSIGVLLCAIVLCLAYFNCLREFQMTLPVSEGFAADWIKQNQLRRKITVRQSDKIQTPLTYGILRPVILLPKGLFAEDIRKQEYVLLHEFEHICQFDNVWKFVQVVTVCFHWFNPLVWVMYLLFCRDIEMACDERVLQRIGEQTKSDYAFTLIELEACKSGLTAADAPLYNGFGKTAIECRIKSIMKYRKRTWKAMVAGVCMIVVIAAVFATSAVKINGESVSEMNLSILGSANPPAGLWARNYCGMNLDQTTQMFQDAGYFYNEYSRVLWIKQGNQIKEIKLVAKDTDSWAVCQFYPVEAAEGSNEMLQLMLKNYSSRYTW